MYNRTFVGLKVYDSKVRRKKKRLKEEYMLFFKYCNDILDIELRLCPPQSKFSIMGFSDSKIDIKSHKIELLKLVKKYDQLKIESESWN